MDSLFGKLVTEASLAKDLDGIMSGFFIFSEINVRVIGRFRLQFSLYDLGKGNSGGGGGASHHASNNHPGVYAPSTTSPLFDEKIQIQPVYSLFSDVFTSVSYRGFAGMSRK